MSTESNKAERRTSKMKESADSKFKLSDLQSCGKYTVYLTLVYYFMVLTQVFNLLFMTFADRKPSVKDVCEKDYPQKIGTKACNSTNCWVTVNETTNSTVICSSSTYDFIPIRYDFTVPIEYVKLGTTMQNFGLMAGAVVAGSLADIFGRKKVLLLFTVGLIIFLALTPFATSFIIFTALRFFDMVFTGGKHCVCNPYFMENLPDKHRMWVATVVTYSPNYIVLAGVAYLCKEWKTLSWTAAGITVIPLIMLPFLRDTPRWLIKKGKGVEASKAAIYIRKWDEKMTPEREKQIADVVQKAADEELEKMKMSKKKNYYFYHLFNDRKLGSYATVFAISLFSTSFVAFGVAYNMDALAGSVYVNVIILGAARWIINITAAGLEYNFKKIGRRCLHLTAVGFISVTMAVIFVVYLFTWPRINEYKEVVRAGGTGDPTVHLVVAFTRFASILAAAMCTEVFVLNSVQPTELFPTPIRSAGIAFIQVFNRLGTIVSPLVFIPSKHWPPAPFLLMFVTSAIDFMLYFLIIPETRGKKLPDNMPGELESGEKGQSKTDADPERPKTRKTVSDEENKSEEKSAKITNERRKDDEEESGSEKSKERKSRSKKISNKEESSEENKNEEKIE